MHQHREPFACSAVPVLDMTALCLSALLLCGCLSTPRLGMVLGVTPLF